MSLFDIIRYPISDVPRDEEWEILPETIKHRVEIIIDAEFTIFLFHEENLFDVIRKHYPQLSMDVVRCVRKIIREYNYESI